MELEALIESLLFVADHPVTVAELATALQVDAAEVEAAVQSLRVKYQERGIRLQRVGDALQLVSAPEAGPQIERFLGLESSGRLSSAALETLSIVCYHQPITRVQIEAVRGVDSTSVLRSLVRRGFFEEVGRAETVGRPILFGTTFEFLQHFGLESPEDLPQWEELNKALTELEASAD